MNGKEILDSIINKRLKNGRIQSFFLNGELVDRINVTYLKFDNWISIVSTDEMTTIRKAEDSFESIKSYGDGEFNYPVEQAEIHFPEFEKYIEKKVVGWKELVWKKDNDLSFGINLYFENNLNLIIHNETIPDDKNEYIFENKLPKDLTEK
tara:strand:+ start:2086 stop:2538 length:453 start_codon:yes stop_codon:yes gene_type:complete